MSYDDNQRERARVTFLAQRLVGGSIEDACRAAEISTSTYYTWKRTGAWTLGDGWRRDGTTARGPRTSPSPGRNSRRENGAGRSR